MFDFTGAGSCPFQSHSSSCPTEHKRVASTWSEMAGQQGEGSCAKHSCLNKERAFINCWSVHHMSFVSFLVLIKIFMAEAARTWLAAHDEHSFCIAEIQQDVRVTVMQMKQKHLTYIPYFNIVESYLFIILMFTHTLSIQISSLTADLWSLLSVYYYCQCQMNNCNKNPNPGNTYKLIPLY